MAHSRFVIVGGGTAGWITAFILRDCIARAKLDASVAVVESSKIPTVGVGEATTAAFHVFLRHFGIDIFEFMRSCEATYKLGIRHQDWRRKGVTYYGPIDDPHQVIQPPPGAPSDYLNVYAVSVGKPVQDMHMFGPLLERKKAPWTTKADGSLLPLGPFLPAYHFDQSKVGKFLKAKSVGVEVVDNVLAGVERDGESGDVTALVFEDGEKLEGDFFIDATGFRKRLIVKELNAPWVSYQNELPVNRALPFWLPVEEGQEIANYTLAWAQEAGWMWQIPTQSRYGCGYVYSDQFSTPEQAHAEVERVLGRKIEVRDDIKFQIGRLENAWIGNMLAVGLSSSFLEPLESTSIHGTIVQMMMFGG
ncbi:MAG: tryptophan 7-halogenase, partial [Devosia sp.]